MALSFRSIADGSAWERIPAIWQFVAWLFLFLFVSRLLYLPWSQPIEASNDSELTAPPNTSLVLEGVGQGNASVVTLQFDQFRGVRVESPSAALGNETLAMLASVGSPFPQGAVPAPFAWNVSLPPGTAAGGTMRIEFAPKESADLAIGTKDGTLQFGSGSDLTVTPVAQDYGAIRGWLESDGQAVTAVPDLIPVIRAATNGKGGSAHVKIAYSANSFEFFLGDLFQDEEAVPVRSVALIDSAGQLVQRICGAPDGALLFGSALFQPRLEPQPPASACRLGFLTASGLKQKDGKFVLGLRGDAFVPGMSQWVQKLQSNIVLWPLIGALIAIPGQKLLKLLSRLFEKRSPQSDRA